MLQGRGECIEECTINVKNKIERRRRLKLDRGSGGGKKGRGCLTRKAIRNRCADEGKVGMHRIEYVRMNVEHNVRGEGVGKVPMLQSNDRYTGGRRPEGRP